MKEINYFSVKFKKFKDLFTNYNGIHWTKPIFEDVGSLILSRSTTVMKIKVVDFLYAISMSMPKSIFT